MSKIISELLGEAKADYAAKILKMENIIGKDSLDIRLGADIIGKINIKIRALGLNSTDPSGPEIYFSLMSTVRMHDDFLMRHLGENSNTNTSTLLSKIVILVKKIRMPRNVWVIKHSAAKKLLKNQPPKHLMKLLGYRSLESLLKRESMGLVFAGIQFAESAAWQKKFKQSYSLLQPSDFEPRKIDISYAGNARWQKATAEFVKSTRSNIISSKEMGSIVVLPLPATKLRGLTIYTLTLLIQTVTELRTFSSFIKLRQVQPNFGDIVKSAVLSDELHGLSNGGSELHWRIIQRHFGAMSNLAHPDVFEPHLQPEDLQWRKAENILINIEPALQFWENMDYVGLIKDGQIVSFNILDAATNYINDRTYGNQVYGHMQASLRNELYFQYYNHPILESRMLLSLENEMSGNNNNFYRLVTA